MAKRATVEDILTKKKPVSRVVEIVLDGDVADQWADVQNELTQAQSALEKLDTPENRAAIQNAEDKCDELRPAVEAATVEMVVQSIGRRAYEGLLSAYPATKDQKYKARKDDPRAVLAFDPDLFPAALLAASLVEPKMTEDEVEEMMNSEAYNSAELSNLVVAALEVNQTSKVVQLGKGSALIRS